MIFVIAVLLAFLTVFTFLLPGRGIVIAFRFLLVVATIFTAAASTLTQVPAGHVGVPVLFGKVQDYTLAEGLHVVNPLLSVEKMSVRTEVYTMSSAAGDRGKTGPADGIVTLSSDGLRMPVDVSIAYRLVGEDAAWVYRNIGPDYVHKIIRPASRTAVREATARFSAQDAYAVKREELAQVMEVALRRRIAAILEQYEFEGTAVVVQQVLLRNVDLPPRVKESIEEKLAAEQDAQRMQFVLAKERQEAERKRIEAEGIRDFQVTVSEGIDDNLLRWKGIDATLQVAQSDNAKIVIVGSGKDGLPIILNPPQ
jgi:regulator of protease activity HflC (stomatin/prohibitin superfamily)